MLKVDGIDVFYGNIHALKGVSLEVNKGEIVTLIGANGAGKTTLLKTISGLLRPKNGDIVYEGASIAGKAAQTIVKQGISHVPEGRRVFANMTVEENLELGAFLRKDKEGIQQDFAKVFQLFPRLEERASSWPARFRAASSKCSPSAARSWRARSCSCLTNRQWGSRRFWSRRFSASFRKSTSRGRRFCLSNKTPIWRSPSPIAPMSLNRGASSCRERRASCRRASR